MGTPNLSRSVSPFPDFVIIGAAKAGTTTVAQLLARHPEICFSRVKEPEILRKDIPEEKIHRAYGKMFAGEQPGQIRGEASTAYSGWSNWRAEKSESKLLPPPDAATAAATMMEEIGQTAQRLARCSPQARIIYMVRHPVDRIYSQIQYNTRHGAVPVNFETAIQVDPRYIQVSHYAEILRLYLGCFPRENFLFATLDDVVKDLPGLLERVQDFLGVSRAPNLIEAKVFTNEGKHHQLRRALAQRFHKIPGYGFLRRVTPLSVREAIFELMKGTSVPKTAQAAPILPETRARLLEHFVGLNREFQEMTGINTSHWNK